ncbi:MAG: NAD(P)-dependent dehydrogenase (short-subunit alcohol dehydrogenase family) [Myxococcota bacterium]|jgi:NAD(P)-dependent dehydrogenase (short-subunit alcohol dehydrogenase family)
MKTAVVTGANRGIGLEMARRLSESGAHVVAACRRSSPELVALGVEIVSLDVTDAASLAELGTRLGGRSVDLVVNNAGILNNDTLGSLDPDSLRAQFEVNALGPLRTTEALRPALTKGAVVAIVTSRMGSIADNSSGGAYGYRMSKAAVNAAGVSLARDLAPSGVAVVLLHPGWVRTDMTGGRGNWSAGEAADGLLARIDETNLANTGRFVHADGTPLPW